MRQPDNPGDSPSNGGEDVGHLLEFVRQSREALDVPAGAVVFREGDRCRGAYFVEAGELLLTITSGERQLRISAAKAGHLLGVSSVVRQCEYQYTAQATSDCRLLLVPADELREYLREHPEGCLSAAQKLGADLLDLSERAIRPLRLRPRNPKLP